MYGADCSNAVKEQSHSSHYFRLLSIKQQKQRRGGPHKEFFIALDLNHGPPATEMLPKEACS